MGKPLILTNIRGCREVVTDGVEGLLIPPRDAERLSAAIARMVGTGRCANALGKQPAKLSTSS